MPNPIYFPFGGLAQASSQQVFPFDLIVNEAYPGLVLNPTEPSSVYSALREVSGCVWWVLNADYNQNTNQWEQDSPTNPSLPAYALEQCQNGSITRYVTAATIIPGTAITWVPVWTMDANGYVTLEPRPATGGSQVGEIIDLTWTAGSSTQMSATRLNVTDSSSASTSFIQDERVNGSPKWQVQKDGTLITGIIPFARITGYTPPSFNNPTFTGTTTMTGPVIMESTAEVQGLLDADGGLDVTGGATTDTLNVTGAADFHGTTTAHNGLVVVGGETVDSIDVTSSATLPASTFPVGSVSGTAEQINVAAAGNALTLSLINPYPVAITSSFVTPAVGSTVNIVTNSHLNFPLYTYLVIGDYPSTAQFICQFTNTGGGTIFQVTCLEYQVGGPGITMPANTTYVFNSAQPDSSKVQAVATNFAPAATTGTLTMSPLAGGSANRYLVICSGSLEFQNASRQLTLTGSGATWPSSPQIYQNANAGTFPFTFYGTATGGQTPSVTWTCNDVLFAEPMTMVMVAYPQ